MTYDEVTKEQLWMLLGAYINHVGDCEGIDFLSSNYTPSKWLSMEDVELLNQASEQTV
jgi:hypothetical protein